MSDLPVLTPMSLTEITTSWRPGSYDWTWREEYEDVMKQDRIRGVRDRVNAEGLGFIDHIAPILLGNDGRVWDGHHRICLALENNVDSVMVELVATKEEK